MFSKICRQSGMPSTGEAAKTTRQSNRGKWQGQQGSNLRPAVLETAALPTELYPFFLRPFAPGGGPPRAVRRHGAPFKAGRNDWQERFLLFPNRTFDVAWHTRNSRPRRRTTDAGKRTFAGLLLSWRAFRLSLEKFRPKAAQEIVRGANHIRQRDQLVHLGIRVAESLRQHFGRSQGNLRRRHL